MRTILILLAALALAGCNAVHSRHPLLPHAVDDPVFRPGLWVGVDDKCVFDANQPLGQWPECASGVLIGPTLIEDVSKKDDDAMIYRLGGQAPVIFQWRYAKKTVGEARKLGAYQYAGLKIVSRDDAGRVTGAVAWMAQCGPPPPASAVGPGKKIQYVTSAPLPGVRIMQDNCVADSFETVRASVVASEAWADPPSRIRWVRR